MTSAAVGFQCPECVAQGRAATRQTTTLAGGVVPSRPIITISLVAINVVVFGIGLLTQAAGGSNTLNANYGMWPIGIALQGEWWRLITSAFLHGGLLHIGFNMYVLWMLGPVVERVLGSTRFLIVYLLAALGGSVASYSFSPANTLSVGASGAIFGLMAALLVVGRQLRHDISQVAMLLAVNFAIGFLVAGIDWRAHLGGALTGAVMAAVMTRAPHQSRVLWQTLGTLAVLMVLVVIVILRTVQLQNLLLG
jgi:membrane associated rhomboid family serine protease